MNGVWTVHAASEASVVKHGQETDRNPPCPTSQYLHIYVQQGNI